MKAQSPEKVMDGSVFGVGRKWLSVPQHGDQREQHARLYFSLSSRLWHSVARCAWITAREEPNLHPFLQLGVADRFRSPWKLPDVLMLTVFAFFLQWQL